MAQFDLTTNDSRCKWRAGASDNWINSINPNTGTGSVPSITFNVDPNSGSFRTGTIRIYNTNNDPNGTNIVANVLIEQDGSSTPTLTCQSGCTSVTGLPPFSSEANCISFINLSCPSECDSPLFGGPCTPPGACAEVSPGNWEGICCCIPPT